MWCAGRGARLDCAIVVLLRRGDLPVGTPRRSNPPSTSNAIIPAVVLRNEADVAGNAHRSLVPIECASHVRCERSSTSRRNGKKWRRLLNSCGCESDVLQAPGHEVESYEMEQDSLLKALPISESTRHLLHPLNPSVLRLQHRV